MEGSFSILLIGWGLLGQCWMSRGELHPKPSISVHPGGVVALGGNFSIRCWTESQPQAEYYLSKEANSHLSTSAVKVAESYEVVFPFINASKSDGGKYWCIYHFTSNPHKWSHRSETVYINLTDPTLPKPSIWITRRKTALGQNVTIKCQGEGNNLAFALHKASMQIPFQTTKPERDKAQFPFFMVRSEDAGNYTCQYHRRGNPFVWSESSEPVELILKGEGKGKGKEERKHGRREDQPSPGSPIILPASVAAGLLLLVLLILLLVFVLWRKKRNGSSAKDERQPMDKVLVPDAGIEPDEVSYAVLNHQSRKTKQAPNLLERSPEACVYASVAKN